MSADGGDRGSEIILQAFFFFPHSNTRFLVRNGGLLNDVDAMDTKSILRARLCRQKGFSGMSKKSWSQF